MAPTALAQKQAALHAPPGTFTWRYADTPAQLQALWQPNLWTRMTQGAVMAFQHDHGLAVDGIPGPMTWHTLIKAAMAGEKTRLLQLRPRAPERAADADALEQRPHDPQARVNTGVPAAPTPLGTHAVFEHIPVGTMSGQNPDGSHYHDPGIKWISYFNGGEAIHGFNRATYGFPQSVGCVEAPIDTAARSGRTRRSARSSRSFRSRASSRDSQGEAAVRVTTRARAAVRTSIAGMRLSPSEQEKLLLSVAGMVARERRARGVKLNQPEAVALLSCWVLEAARDGDRTVEQLMQAGREVLGRDEVMEGVPELVDEVQIEATFPDGRKLVTLHQPIQ